MTDPTKVLYTRAEAAEALGISVATLDRLHRQGHIAFRRLSARHTRVHRDAIEDYAASLESF